MVRHQAGHRRARAGGMPPPGQRIVGTRPWSPRLSSGRSGSSRQIRHQASNPRGRITAPRGCARRPRRPSRRRRRRSPHPPPRRAAEPHGGGEAGRARADDDDVEIHRLARGQVFRRGLGRRSSGRRSRSRAHSLALTSVQIRTFEPVQASCAAPRYRNCDALFQNPDGVLHRPRHRPRRTRVEGLRHLGRVPAIAVEGGGNHGAIASQAPPACRARAGGPSPGARRASAPGQPSGARRPTTCSAFSTNGARLAGPTRWSSRRGSSALPLPGIEVDRARHGEGVRFSITSAEAEHCTVAKAGVEPLLAGEQVARQAVAHDGVDEARQPALGDRCHVGHGDGEEVHGLGHVLAVEMPTRERDVAAPPVVDDERVVVAEFSSVPTRRST